MEGRLILWLAFTSVMLQDVGSNSWPLYLQSDALATALSRPACVMIMSDCKSCVLFLSKKTSGADEGPGLSTEGWLVLIIYAPPPHTHTSKNLKGHIVFALFVILFVFFTGDWNIFFSLSIFMCYPLPHTKQYNSSISQILCFFLLNHTMYQLGTC